MTASARSRSIADALVAAARILAIALAGAVLAYGLTMVWDLETRWLVVVVAGLIGLALAMLLVKFFSDVLTIGCLCLIPLFSFGKWFWPTRYLEDERGNLVYAGLFGVSPLDFVVIGLYLSWFYRTFALHETAVGRLTASDCFVAAYVVVYLLSTLESHDPELALGATEYLVKYALLYLYLSRCIEPRHLPFILAAFAFAITIEAGLSTIQFSSGKLLGIALDKGAGSSEVDYQYTVPGIESLKRATGTCYDSHSLGNLMAMLLPFPLVLYFTPTASGLVRFLSAVFALLAAAVIVMTLSRAAWVSSALSLGLGVFLITGIWRERQVMRLMFVSSAGMIVVAPFLAIFIYNRFADSPYEVLTTRFDQYKVALQIIGDHPFFGIGPGNWINALNQHDFLWLEVLPPHDVLLWILAETGIFGATCYLALLIAALRRLARMIVRRRDLPGRLAMATLIALASTILIGLTDPTYREPNVFAMFWVLIALSAALPRMPTISPAVLLRKSARPRLSVSDLFLRSRGN